MLVMTDLEMTKLCAKAMRTLPHIIEHNGEWRFGFNKNALGPAYDPRHDDAQAMALVKKLQLQILIVSNKWLVVPNGKRSGSGGTDFNLAIVKCVANMQRAKAKAA